MKPKDDLNLSLTEAETLLSGFLARLQAIKAESIQLRQQRPTRAEVADSVSAWLDRQVAASGATLLDRLANIGFMTDTDANIAPGVRTFRGRGCWVLKPRRHRIRADSVYCSSDPRLPGTLGF